MKKTLLSLIFGASFCMAQTTITKAFNDPIVGDVVNNVSINGTVDNSATGNNVTFQNSTLTQGLLFRERIQRLQVLKLHPIQVLQLNM